MALKSKTIYYLSDFIEVKNSGFWKLKSILNSVDYASCLDDCIFKN